MLRLHTLTVQENQPADGNFPKIHSPISPSLSGALRGLHIVPPVTIGTPSPKTDIEYRSRANDVKVTRINTNEKESVTVHPEQLQEATVVTHKKIQQSSIEGNENHKEISHLEEYQQVSPHKTGDNIQLEEQPTRQSKVKEQLRTTIITPTKQQPKIFEKQFIITTNTSENTVGASLSRGEIGQDQAVRYASRTLTKAEQNYTTTEKELLAIDWAIVQFQPYMYETPPAGITNRKTPILLSGMKDPGSRFMRWEIKLPERDIDIQNEARKNNANTDAPSKTHVTTTEQGQTFHEKSNCSISTYRPDEEDRGKIPEENPDTPEELQRARKTLQRIPKKYRRPETKKRTKKAKSKRKKMKLPQSGVPHKVLLYDPTRRHARPATLTSKKIRQYKIIN